ncbi:methyltransferase [Fusarium heterosporum]|uniref:Methyltransferase n=1 Tax=Fusarium heterosporum TaxID=42747 RepID=A0A8H5SW92_FUSHE|nr:methyltransferase [Fusarium heterosporum]
MSSETNERPEDVSRVTILEAEDDIDDTDSTLESGDGSSSYLTSLKSSIFNYRYEPNDEEEQSRMDLCHHIYSLLLKGKLHTAPIGDSSQRVLDLGTGTGIWAIDFADEHPSAEVIGTDLSPIQPDWIPNNCVFEVDDFEDPWIYKKPFDYIHARELEGCISNEEHFFEQAFQNLNSGGYLELQAQRGVFLSDDDTVKKAVNAEVWAEAVRDSSSKFGKPIDCVRQWKDKMIKAGFVEVHEEIRKIPIGGWPKDPVMKEVGKCQVIQSCAAIDSYTPMLLGKILGWGQDEMQVLMAKAKKELRDPSIHIYMPVYFVWGKRP